MNAHPPSSTASAHLFGEVVCLKLRSGWRYVETGEQAIECLREAFDDQNEPSWQRAFSTCSAFLRGQVGAEAAKSTFIVAAMAAGIGFELAENLDVMERHIEEAASEGMMSILFDEGSAE